MHGASYTFTHPYVFIVLYLVKHRDNFTLLVSMISSVPYHMLVPHRLVIRIRCDAAIAQCQLGMKFGCDTVTEAPHLLKVAHFLGLDVVGVSFHVGSGCDDPSAFHKAIASAKMVFDVGTSLGYNFHLLDIGGGYPGNKGLSIDKVSIPC
jgi:ornithine decarboxylase